MAMRVLIISILFLSSYSTRGQRLHGGQAPFDIPLPIQTPGLYKDKGKIKEILEFDDANKKMVSLTRKNRKGDIVLRWYGKDSIIYEYEYNKLGQITRTSRNYFTIETRKYDNKNRLINKTEIVNGHFWAFPDTSQKKWYEGHKKIESFQYHSKFEYTKYVIKLKGTADTFLVYQVKLNKELNPIKIRKINTEWPSSNSIAIMELEYDVNGNISKSIYYPEDPKENILAIEKYKYDNLGRISSFETEVVDKSNDSLTEKYGNTTQYDYYKDSSLNIVNKSFSNGNLVRIQISLLSRYGHFLRVYEIENPGYSNSNDPIFYEEYNEIAYDEMGNWVLFKHRRQNRYDDIIEESEHRRVIKYHK